MPSTDGPALSDEDRALLEAMASEDTGLDTNTRRRAHAVLEYFRTLDIRKTASNLDMGIDTVRKHISRYQQGGWHALLTVGQPRGGDFLARYDQGYWAERLVRTCLDLSRGYRAIPYGTSRSEPFQDFASFRQYKIDEFLLNAWSSQTHCKRPDLLAVPRNLLAQQKGNDQWTPDLLHWDNDDCSPYVSASSAAFEVETSLWQVDVARHAGTELSFTVKDEDLRPISNWCLQSDVPLFIVQVFYDQTWFLPFSKLRWLISESAPTERRIAPAQDRITGKVTFMIPLAEGSLLGAMPEPEVEGRIYKAPNGKVTVYGRLTGSSVQPVSMGLIEGLVSGALDFAEAAHDS